MLINTARLQENLKNPDWVVFDCRHDLGDPAKGAKLYAEGHVPGAFFASVDTDLSGTKTGTNGRHPLPSPEAFAEFLNRHGVTPSTRIVAYDDVGGQFAARFWWLARWIGLRHAAVLDGGLPKWTAGGYPLNAHIPQARRRGSVVARPDGGMVKGADEILAKVRTGHCPVVDARAPERFRGEVEPMDTVAGHIPHARNRFYKLNLRPDLTLRSPLDLKKEFETLLEGHPADQVVHQCGSGLTACANLLAMEHAGLTGSTLYPGSWSEWIADPARPVALG